MSTKTVVSPPLNETQLMLLRLFSRAMTETEMRAVRQILLDYYEKELQEELDRVVTQKKITRKNFEELLEKQQRTK